MIASPPRRRLSLAAVLAVAVSALLLALPSSSLGRARKASCHATTHATHAKRAARKCPAPAHKVKPTSAAHHSSAKGGHKSKASGSLLASEEAGDEAKCEDGSLPSASPEGTFSCEDGSEPSCPSGLIAVPSSDGSVLLCEALPAEGEAEPEPEES